MTNVDGAAAGFKLVGGHLALDFANTASWHARPAPEELLTGYARLLDWSTQVGTLTPAQVGALRRCAERRPAATSSAHAGAIALREALYRLFSAQAAGRPLAAIDLALLNAALTEALPHRQLILTADGPTWAWVGPANAPERPLWPVIWAAADLLAAPERTLIRECDGEGCGWLFLDTSRNHRRRWCDTRDCGNRERVRRHYARQRGLNLPDRPVASS